MTQSHQDTLQPNEVGTILAITVLFAPFGMMLDQYDFTISSFFWNLVYNSGRLSVSFISFSNWTFIFIVFLSLRIWFVALMMRVYTGKTGLKRALSIGVVSEIPVVILSLINSSFVLVNPEWPYLIIGIPTPLLFIIAYLLVRFRPPQKDVVEWLE